MKLFFRYFIIIDDIWDIQTWQTLDCALYKNSCGSVIMTTTRIHDVAISCHGSSSDGLLLRMQPLSIADSKKLFFKRIFGSEEKCPPNLKEASEDILTKCGGLPLAIIAISSLLATRKTKEVWECVRCSIGFGQGRNSDIDAMNCILSLSYFDLPLYLRSCLLYLTMFPEDSEVEGQILVRRWISEGLVHGEHGQDLVELGERYLYELSNRSLIQLVDVGNSRMELGCRVHDTILDFLIYKATEENFCTLLRKCSRPDSRIRRLTLLENEDQCSLERLDLSHVRSLAAFGNADQLPSVVQSSALRVLDLSFCSGIENDHIKDIGRLLLLRYLSISSTNISELPRQIGNLVYLETLDASWTKLVELPESVTRLKRLARLFVPEVTKFPDGIGKMEKLQEIGSFINIFKQSMMFLEELGNLMNLRKLRITWDTDELNRARLKRPLLVASLSKLDARKLHSLSIKLNLSENDATLLAGPQFFLPALKSIRDIRLHSGKLCWIKEWLLSLDNLERLSLKTGDLCIEQQDVEMIGSIPTLLELVCSGCFVGPIIISSNSRTFQQLEYLELCGDVTQWTFEAGAMPGLKKLLLWIALYDSESYAGFDYSGFLLLPSLASVVVHICYLTAAAAYAEAVREGFNSMCDAHANRPLLKVVEGHVQTADEC